MTQRGYARDPQWVMRLNHDSTWLRPRPTVGHEVKPRPNVATLRRDPQWVMRLNHDPT